MTTRSDMVNAGKEAVRLGVKYIYGAKPEKGRFLVYSRAEIDQLRDWYGSDCVWWSDSDKAGSLCCDCSGLITFATGVVKGSWQLENEALEKVSIQTLLSNWSRYVGWVLWMSGHVGIVSDTYGYYYAMDGSARNAVHLPLEYNSFTKVLRIPGVDYSDPKPEPPKPEPKPEPPRGYSMKLHFANGTEYQEFKLNKKGDYWEIVNLKRDMAIDVRDGAKADHTPVRVWKRNGTDAQLHKLIKVKMPRGVVAYEIEPKCAPGMRIDCINGGTVDKTGLQIHPRNNTDAQRHYLVMDSNGIVRIVNSKSGLAFDCGPGIQP